MEKDKYLYTDTEGRNIYSLISEYEKLKREQSTHGYIRSYWLSEAKQIIKFNIGVLVLKGWLAAMPKIRLENIPDDVNKIN